MFGELQSIANLAKYPATTPVDAVPRAMSKTSIEKRLERLLARPAKRVRPSKKHKLRKRKASRS